LRRKKNTVIESKDEEEEEEEKRKRKMIPGLHHFSDQPPAKGHATNYVQSVRRVSAKISE
jgi:hypothetical protein